MANPILDRLLALTPHEIDAMPPAEQQWVSATLRRETALASPASFAQAHSRGLWLPYRHLVYTSDLIVGMVDDDDCDILIVEEPVRHGKSWTCSKWTPAWYICKYHKRALLCSYEADFAATWGRAARDIVTEVGPEYGAVIDESSRAAARWELKGDVEGGMNTAGAGGPITGKGGDLCIVDDPIKNSKDAQSALIREDIWEWWQGTFLSRREPGAKVIVIMSRWHEDDLVGRLLKNPPEGGARIKRVRLPAVAEDDDPLGRTPGEALCPERYDEQALSGIRVDVGPGPWASLYQQRPVPKGGGMFKKEWFEGRYTQIVTSDDEVAYQLDDRIIRAENLWTFSTMDTAYAKNQTSDYTVIATWGVVQGATSEVDGETVVGPPMLMLLEVKRKRVEHFEHAPLIRDVWARRRPTWVGIEKIDASRALFAEAQRDGIVCKWLEPETNKIARAETAAALAAAGRIWLPVDADWLTEWLDEVVTFPVAKHDDQVDTLSYAARELAQRTVRPRRVKHEPTTPSDKMWERLRERDKRRPQHPTLGRWQ